MYLSKLELIGFKSFAQKVNLQFDNGITSIVGPNGCGKTNIVDAIRWVLGEQRSSTLRSDKMEDVIFNGTKNRKPLGMAEVSLTIENTKGILPTEYSEVTITRRVFRSGESDYLINGTPCRLKDIINLFMDTGMGADAYSVIELKMVETILSDRADDRRRLFEEAAGVTKYKYRRKQAYQKLESVQDDLMRVNDIVKEVEKTVTTLERQAKKAEQYNEYSERLKALEIDLLEREYATISKRLGPLEEKLSTTITEKNRIDEELSRKEALLEVLRGELKEVEQKLIEAQKDLNAQTEKIHRFEEKNLIAEERKKSLESNIARYEKETIDLQNQKVKLEAEKETFQAKIVEIQAALAKIEHDHAKKKLELEQFERTLEAKKAQVKEYNDEVIALINEIAEKKSELNRLKARIENIHGRIELAAEENLRAEEERKKSDEALAQLSAQDKEHRRNFAEAEMKLAEMERLKQSLEDEIKVLRDKEFELRSVIERKTARMQFLKNLVESHDEFSEGTKFLVAHEEGKFLIRTTVTDSIQTDAKFRVAVESALGEATGYIVVNNLDEACRGIEILKQTQKGKATFICLDRLPQINGESGVPLSDGIHGWAVDLIHFEEKYRPLFNFLLDRTVIVDNIDVAKKVLNNGSHLKCVTLDGEIITSSGVVKGGSSREEEGGTIGKKIQIEELQQEISDLQRHLDEVHHLLEQKNQEHTIIDLKVYADAVKTFEHEMMDVEVAMAQIEFEKKRATELIQRNNTEREKLRTEEHSLEESLNLLSPGIGRLENAKIDYEQQLTASTQELERLENQWNELSQTVNGLNMQVVNLRADLQRQQRELEFSNVTIREILSTLDRRAIDIASAEEEIERLSAEIEENNSILGELNQEFALLQAKQQEVQREQTDKQAKIHEIEVKIRDERQLHDKSINISHELELKISEMKSKLENLKQQALEQFEHELQLKTYPEDDQFSFGDAREEVRNLKAKIRYLGAVNFAAFDEYKKEKERFDFLTSQRNDLLEAEKTLLDTIEEINMTAQKKFLDTFEKIRENFISTFKSLFDEGDECDLRLEEGIDPLEAKIEIIAKPRGKRPQSIVLLSGGEKTLTAIALLFAIYLVKPSPFCILDEVDAPLDDSNIDRFTKILNKFCDNTQFIVVTHNKRTMEAANALYGVTMEEDGVSKIVSVRFNESAVASGE